MTAGSARADAPSRECAPPSAHGECKRGAAPPGILLPPAARLDGDAVGRDLSTAAVWQRERRRGAGVESTGQATFYLFRKIHMRHKLLSCAACGSGRTCASVKVMQVQGHQGGGASGGGGAAAGTHKPEASQEYQKSTHRLLRCGGGIESIPAASMVGRRTWRACQAAASCIRSSSLAMHVPTLSSDERL